MPESIPAPRPPWLGWILSVPDTHQKTVLAALDKEEAIRVLTCATEDEAAAVAAGLWGGGAARRSRVPATAPHTRAARPPLRRPARGARGAGPRPPHSRVLPAGPPPAGARRGPRGPGDQLMAIKPEDALRAIAAVRGDAICVPTMTTAPAWREIAPEDLSVTCVGFMGGASSLGLGAAPPAPE